LSQRKTPESVNTQKYSKQNSFGLQKVKDVVLQGLILGPLFFLLYIDDLPKITPNNAKLVLYADDSSILLIPGLKIVTKLI
jgi:hypothetical protein